ncbi:MAG: hypothetical protein CBC40_02725 [bacterium TMED80]|nr:MAG: hypothetical protein CBC40_02725 [bacterium TMED80]
MMNKYSKDTLILFIFTINVLSLVFLGDNSPILGLFNKLISIAGLSWLVNYFYKTLKFKNSSEGIDLNQHKDKYIIKNNPNSQFSDLIDAAFSLIKDISHDFEAGIYFFQPDSKLLELKSFTSEIFIDSLPLENNFIEKLNGDNQQNLFYQKDNKEYWHSLFKEEPIKGSECVILQPIIINEVIAGFIVVKSDHFSNVNENNQKIIKHIADIITIGILDLDILEKTINNKNDQNQIFDLLTDINLSQSESDILNKFRNIINYYFEYDCLTFSAINKDGKNAVIKLIDGIKKNLPSENSFNVNGTINGLSYIKNDIVVGSNEQYNLFRFSPNEKNDFSQNNFLSVPLFLNESLWGAITIERFTHNNYNNKDKDLLSLIARALQTSMSWFIEYQNIYEDAIKDGLTGLLNHKTFNDRAKEEIERARRFQHQLVFLIYDLDKFKRINDTLGHPYGDYVIKTTAKIIKDNVRSVDLVARYGGEEFTVVLVNTNKEAATTVAKRIVQNIQDYNFSMNGEEVNMTISCGLSEYPKDSDTLKDLIQFADEGLYKTKENGGNDVTIYSSISG